MSLIIAGTIRVPAENLQALRPHMRAMVEASRAEDGCIQYAYGEDVLEPGLIRVFEAWRDQAALDAHFQSPHIAAWRSRWPALGVDDRRLTLYEVTAERPL
ncbi:MULTISPECIES: putative quinol monooxygenase [Phenylobacterium]|uniref:Quinol monooxygenase YgiN n=1 Tax=Phenylobacterium koreense TaxID=266125 RepID=A0ABV2EHT5_9CAUL